MIQVRWILLSLLLRPSATSLLINFQVTDAPCANNDPTRHHCLDVPMAQTEENHIREIISYCLTECSYEWMINHTGSDHPAFTFQQLVQQEITSQHLYAWSAPIDVIERYQLYLDQLEHSPSSEVSQNDIYYNCTWPRFGSFCQFSFDHLSFSSKSYSSLVELITEYYLLYRHHATTLTCYEHLRCHRGPAPACLDWTEICDGRIDCIDGGQDEKDCWVIEVSECEENEHRCYNGQCIPKAFYQDNPHASECLDSSDEPERTAFQIVSCKFLPPIFRCEDITCPVSYEVPPRSITSTCSFAHNQFLTQIMLSARPDDLSEACWFALLCTVDFARTLEIDCGYYCHGRPCQTILQENCSKPLFLVPSVPLIAGHFHFAYTKDHLFKSGNNFPPEYICFGNEFCPMLPIDQHTIQLGNTTCYYTASVGIKYQLWPPFIWLDRYLLPTLRQFGSCISLPEAYFHYCDRYPHYYRCRNSSKCVPKRRLLDGFRDCLFGDDEDMNFVGNFTDLETPEDFFKCPSFDRYISQSLVGNKICDCYNTNNNLCDDEYSDDKYSESHLSFQTTCDGFTELKPRLVDGRWMNDETDCEHWFCDNIYTRCDKIWHCLDGRDEVDCNASLPINCSSDSRLCVPPETNTLTCLPVEKVNDGHVDCLGALDERKLCRDEHSNLRKDRFYCRNNSANPCFDFAIACSGFAYCAHGDDEMFCRHHKRDQLKQYVNEHFVLSKKPTIVHFSLLDRPTRKQQLQLIDNDHLSRPPSLTEDPVLEFTSYDNHCHRGLNLRVWRHSSSSSNLSTIACLCPPSFYGDRCQYQNQRISLTLQFRALSDSWQTTFSIIILLIDHTNQRSIHSAQQLTYLPFRDCQIKFNTYLLFSTRPKNLSLNYSIHIDVYEQVASSHQHRTSYLVPLRFPFLPVQRIALQLDIPRITDHQTDLLCTNPKCSQHGRCIRYAHVYHSSSSHLPSSFCQCDQGWSGRDCSIPISCSCSSQSLCLGSVVANGRSICVCPSGRAGPRCLLDYDYRRVCLSNSTMDSPCFNGGRCIPHEPYRQEQSSQAYTCLCPRGYTGDRCEQKQTQFLISFHQDLVSYLVSSMLVHFIRYHHDRRHANGTAYKTIPLHSSPISIYWPHPFHLVFLEFNHPDHRYYLAVMRRIYNRSELIIEKRIESSDRCPHIRELFNETMLRLHRLQQIKYYHLLCQSEEHDGSLLACFYDDHHLCLCHESSPNVGRRRTEANCFEYDHERKFDCLGRNGCENGGQCFQDDPTCPRTSICICQECFYGRRCQFTMDGFRLSLDAILGYHIQPHLPLHQQPLLVQLALFVTLVMTFMGIINGFLSLITFTSEKLRQVGCGFYLLGSSITSLLTMTLFLIKFIILLVTQMGFLRNRSFLQFQCGSLDYLLRVFLNMDQWFNACVSFERTMASIQGVNFNRGKSKQQAKQIIVGLVVLLLISTLYDPIHRRLIEDKYDGEDRVWCIVSYSPWLRVFDSSIHMIHFCFPFVINIFAALIIIWQSAQYRRNTQNNLRFQQILRSKVREHMHILVAPVVIVLLSLPRLILSVVSGCMTSGRQSHLYLAGYFISFTPPMLIFIIFILPSKLYKSEFQRSILRYRNRFRLRIGTIHPLFIALTPI